MSLNDPTIDSISGSDSSLKQTLSSLGVSFTFTTNSKYVVHMVTLPLCSTLYNWTNPIIKNHDIPDCDPETCMFISKNKPERKERISETCPCRQVEEYGSQELRPMCFFNFLKKVSDPRKYPEFKPEQVMFCKNSVSLFDHSYPAWVKRAIDISSFDKVYNLKKLKELLNLTYWYKEYKKTHRLDMVLEECEKRVTFKGLIRDVKQTMYTINGLLIKKFLVFGDNLSSYEDIARQTAMLFKSLMYDYSKPTEYYEGYPIQQESIYTHMKDHFNWVKQWFNKPDKMDRIQALQYKFKDSSLKYFWMTEINNFYGRVASAWSADETDLTTSLLWSFKMTMLSQTRVIGYLPRALSEAKAHHYRMVISREPLKFKREDLYLLYASIQKELTESPLPEFILQTGELSEEVKQIFLDVIANVELVVKPSASVTSKVSEGGKLEDARRLIRLAINRKWKIPLRDLETGDIIEYITINDDTEQTALSKPIFWISFQIMLNALTKKGAFQGFYYELPGSDPWSDGAFEARVLHIQEPGKDRNLTKSSSPYTWSLTPAGKICQACLSLLEEHKVGLTGSAHGWKFSRRISGISDESAFIYDNDGLLKPDFIQFYSDWTESTDFIDKEVGGVLFKALTDYVGLPTFYQRFVFTTILLPQNVVETIRHYDDGGNERVDWKGQIKNGFMMGNPITKTILHLCHVAELAVARLILANYHFEKKRYPARIPYNEYSLDKEFVRAIKLQVDGR